MAGENTPMGGRCTLFTPKIISPASTQVSLYHKTIAGLKFPSIPNHSWGNVLNEIALESAGVKSFHLLHQTRHTTLHPSKVANNTRR